MRYVFMWFLILHVSGCLFVDYLFDLALLVIVCIMFRLFVF